MVKNRVLLVYSEIVSKVYFIEQIVILTDIFIVNLLIEVVDELVVHLENSCSYLDNVLLSMKTVIVSNEVQIAHEVNIALGYISYVLVDIVYSFTRDIKEDDVDFFTPIESDLSSELALNYFVVRMVEAEQIADHSLVGLVYFIEEIDFRHDLLELIDY